MVGVALAIALGALGVPYGALKAAFPRVEWVHPSHSL